MSSTIVNNNTKVKNKTSCSTMHQLSQITSYFFQNSDCNTALNLWDNYPSPDLLQKVSLEELTEFLIY